jgi:transcriptional regulator with XRE-family HTH domain
MATVRKLRTALGDTQPQFAARLGLALPTVVRYEHSRRPRAKALALLEQVASANGLEEFGAQFRRALSDELGVPAGDLRSLQVHVKNDVERGLVDALLYAIRAENLTEVSSKAAKAIRRVLKPIVELQRDMRETDEALDAQRRAIAGLLEKGRTAEEVVKLFRITPEALAEAFFKSSMKSFDAKAYAKKEREVVDLLLKAGMSIRRIADEFAGGQADGIYNCAADLGAFGAISEYEEEENAEK